jgi:hypothetical protein
VRGVTARADQAFILDACGVRSPSWSHVAGVRRPSLCHGTAVDCIPELCQDDPCMRVSRSGTKEIGQVCWSVLFLPTTSESGKAMKWARVPGSEAPPSPECIRSHVGNHLSRKSTGVLGHRRQWPPVMVHTSPRRKRVRRGGGDKNCRCCAYIFDLERRHRAEFIIGHGASMSTYPSTRCGRMYMYACMRPEGRTVIAVVGSGCRVQTQS